MKRLRFYNGTFKPQYWLFGWKNYTDRSGEVVEFMDVSLALDCLEKHKPYLPLLRLILSYSISAILCVALLYLTVYLW